MDENPLAIVLQFGSTFAHSPVYFNKKFNRYCPVSRWYLTPNVIFCAIIQSFQVYYVYRTFDASCEANGTVLALLYLLDIQLTICLSYVMIFNGVKQTKTLVKLLNLMKNVIERNKFELGGPKYSKM